MTRFTQSIFDVFVDGTLIDAVRSIFEVFTRGAIILARSMTSRTALLVTSFAFAIVRPVNSAIKNLIN